MLFTLLVITDSPLDVRKNVGKLSIIQLVCATTTNMKKTAESMILWHMAVAKSSSPGLISWVSRWRGDSFITGYQSDLRLLEPRPSTRVYRLRCLSDNWIGIFWTKYCVTDAMDVKCSLPSPQSEYEQNTVPSDRAVSNVDSVLLLMWRIRRSSTTVCWVSRHWGTHESKSLTGDILIVQNHCSVLGTIAITPSRLQWQVTDIHHVVHWLWLSFPNTTPPV